MGSDCVIDDSQTEINQRCCENAGRSWADSEGCCPVGQQQVEGHCCARSMNIAGTDYSNITWVEHGECCPASEAAGDYCCLNYLDNDSEACCILHRKRYYTNVCCSIENDSETCCYAIKPGYEWKNNQCVAPISCGICEKPDANAENCVRDDDRTETNQTCCESEGRDWAAKEPDGHKCCETNYHKTNEHCCPAGVSVDTEESWVEDRCCPNSEVSGSYCCLDHNDNEIAGCCTKHGKTYYSSANICCTNDNDSQACCLAAHEEGYE